MGTLGKPIVLVVEDEPLLRIAAVDMIESAGFDVVEAANAAQAVEILESRTDIRIVYTDLDMPRGIDGMKLAATIRDRWPPIEIVLTSGRSAPRTEDLPARAVFFPKPIREEAVLRELRRMSA